MARRDSRGASRGRADRSDPYADFWDHPGRSARSARSGRSGRAQRPDRAAQRADQPTRRTDRAAWAAPGTDRGADPRMADPRTDRGADRRPGRTNVHADRSSARPERRTDRGDRRAERRMTRLDQRQRREAVAARSGRDPRRAPDGLRTGAVVIVFVVGLSMLAVVENTVLTGGNSRTSDTRIAAADPPSRPKPRRTVREPARPAPPPVQTLDDRVRELTLALRGPAARQSYGPGNSAPPMNGVPRLSSDKTWAVGTTAIPVPAEQTAPPQVALYVAHWSESRWRIALSGTTEFNQLLTRIPAQLMPADERRTLARYSSASGPAPKATGLMLPWRIGGNWTMTAAPGRGGQAARPLAAVAFRGGDGQVRAAGPGRLYRFCVTAPGRGLVMVVHPNGLATTYHQMTDVIQIRDGSVVARGEPLGRIGTDRPCGGAPADRPQVQFALRHGPDGMPFDGAQIGGWTFREQARPMVGWAERGLLQVLPGGVLRNLGPVAPPAPAPAKPGKPGQGKVPGLPGQPPLTGNQERNPSGDPQQ